MIDQKLQDAINEQIKWELYSSYLYMSMASYFDSMNLTGFSKWMKVQAQEELTHALRFYSYVIERGGRVFVQPIDGPETAWDSPLAAMEYGYNHETEVTAKINKLVDMSMKASDHATTNFLQWFVAEQVEEESSFDAVVQQLKLVGKEGNGLFMIDRELGARAFTMPPDLVGKI
jgi:ferritin